MIIVFGVYQKFVVGSKICFCHMVSSVYILLVCYSIACVLKMNVPVIVS